MSHENGTPPEAAIDSHGEESASNAPPLPAPVQAVALAPRPPAEREVLMPLDPEQVVEGVRQYQQLMRDRSNRRTGRSRTRRAARSSGRS